jgi:hypothetical protein
VDYDLIILARKALQPLWEKASLKGRCWGPKRTNNPYSASNITFAVGEELVSISQKEGSLLIHEFSASKGTILGSRVRKMLRDANLMAEEGKVLPIHDLTWFCEVCGKRGGIDYEDSDDPRLIANRIYEAHAKSSPGCGSKNVQIIDRNMVKQEKLMRLISLDGVA